MTPLCVKQYSALNSGLGNVDIDLSVTGSSIMICLTLSSSLSEALFVSGLGSGISSLGRLAVLLVDGIQLVGIFRLPIGIRLGRIGVSNF